MAGRVKPLIIAVVILFTFMITIAYGIEITREEPLVREAIWLELIEPKITPYYVNVWDPDFNVSVAAHTSGPVVSSTRDAEEDIPGEPVLVKNYMDIVVAIHPPDTPGHYSFEVTPDYPENQLIVDSVNPGRATFRTAVFGEFSITPKFHTTDGKVIFLAQGSAFPDPTSKSIPTEAYSLKVSDECEENVRKVDCINDGTNQNCKNIFGVGEQITFFRFQKSPEICETERSLWKHLNPAAGGFVSGETITLDEINERAPIFKVSYNPDVEDIVTNYFDLDTENGVYKFKREYHFKVSEPKVMVPRKFKPANMECASGEQDQTYCSYIGQYGQQGNFLTGKSIGVDAGFYLDIEPTQACFKNIGLRENFNYGNSLGENYCINWVWPKGETFCIPLSGSSLGTIIIYNYPNQNFYRDKAVTNLWPKELMNGVRAPFKFPVSIRIEWTKDKNAVNPVWNELGNSGFCAIFYPNKTANARRVIDKLSENDSPGNPDGPANPCADNGNSLYYTTTSQRGPWVMEPNIQLPN